MRVRLAASFVFAAAAAFVPGQLREPAAARAQAPAREVVSAEPPRVPERAALGEPAAALFQARRPPPAPVVAPAPAPLPMPYRYAGRAHVGGEEQVYLLGGGQVIAVRAGDALEHGWRVAEIDAQGVALQHAQGELRRLDSKPAGQRGG